MEKWLLAARSSPMFLGIDCPSATGKLKELNHRKQFQAAGNSDKSTQAVVVQYTVCRFRYCKQLCWAGSQVLTNESMVLNLPNGM